MCVIKVGFLKEFFFFPYSFTSLWRVFNILTGFTHLAGVNVISLEDGETEIVASLSCRKWFLANSSDRNSDI
jgi:hypothetical protein